MEKVLTKLERVAEIARRKPEERIRSLSGLITPELLEASYRSLRKDAAVGVDGVTVETYGENLEKNLEQLHVRIREMRYRHQPIRRVHIPKDDGRTRPLGVSATEDKIVQRALTSILEAVYEQDFKDFSYGFRPGRSAHEALRGLNEMVYRGKVRTILEADIKGYFDAIDRTKLMEMLRARIADEPLMRLVGKCLHVGVLEGEEYSEPEIGTAQGSIISPLLGNIYLHTVLDTWFEKEVRSNMKGSAYLIRYADDFVMGFTRDEDAEEVMKLVHARFADYGLQLHPDKTRLVKFTPPTDKGNGQTFDFLGFTHHWRKSLRGYWCPAMKTKKKRLQKAGQAITDYCKRHRQEPVKEQHTSLCRRLRGHYNYFGVSGNMRALKQVYKMVTTIWHKWLNRRSQRSRKSWQKYLDMLKTFPLPKPTIRKQMWGHNS